MAAAWHVDPLGQFGPEAACCGCGKGLWRRGDRWADQDGIEVCIKAPPGQPRPDFVFHEPFPAGFRGAPVAP